MYKPKLLSLYIAALFYIVAAGEAHTETKVIVHPSNAINSISKEALAEIFLGKTTIFPNGVKAIPADVKDGLAIRTNFYTAITNKDGAQLRAYWSRLIFTGKGQPPQMLEDDDEIKELVSDNPNTVGYINAEFLDSTVKSIFTIP